MALLVPDIGEQESIRYIVNNTQQAPRNLILKLVSSSTATPAYAPAEADTPKSLRTALFVEPYTYANNATADSSPYGYQKVTDTGTNVISRAPATVYPNQYGILLHGSNWSVSTTAGGTNVTTASYPQQTFQFTSGSTYIHGYYVARANTISQQFLNNSGATAGVTVAATSFTATAAAAIATPVVTNTLGSKILALSPVQQVTASGSQGAGQGVYNSTSIFIGATVSASVGDYVVGTGVGPYARITGISGTTSTTAISVSVPCTGSVSGNTLSFYSGKVAPGQTVADVGNATIPAATTVTGYDPVNGYVFMSAAFTGTVSTTITFSYLNVLATAHGGTNGDVIFLANDTAVITEQSYTIQNVAANSFDTWPAIPSTATTGRVVIYDSIMYEEKFTNGPYYIQNNGDQIKITLNVSLD